MLSAADFVAHARAWVGVPYHHQGRSRYGVDCIGFPIMVLRELEMLPSDFVDAPRYGRTPTGLMEPTVALHCVQLRSPQPGCLLLIRWPRVKFASHAAICAGHTMVHAHQQAGGVVEHGLRGPWLRNLHSVWALPGVSYV